MNEPQDPKPTVDIPSVPADSLDVGLAAGFGRPAEAPRSSLDASQRPVLLHEAEGDSAHVVQPHSDAMPQKSETGDRYQLFGEIARGGMGAVLRGRDVDLGRDLAIKVLLEKHANRPDVARRFLEEAQIGGQLQHPGVVPVYDVGRFGDRPFFTMKLVKDQTLAALLNARADALEDRPRLLGIALQVAQALAYAHAKGVIHRDLKPANVMVGAFGEVQVMDWGLAKVLAEGGVADEERASRQHQPEEGTLIRTARSGSAGSGSGTDTEAGSLLGTPAYMPPEQANGHIANVDRRADVFGLGAILCEILTGKPPYVGRSAEEVRRKAANGDLADATARLDGCAADAELIALAKACLAPEAIDRPKDAREVADRLSAYLDGVQERLQTAQRERAVAEVRADGEARLRRAAEEKAAEQRRRRSAQLALAAAVVLLLLGGGAFAWWQDRQAGERNAAEARLAGERDAEARNKERQARQGVDANLNLANDLRKQYRFKAAEAALAQAGELAASGAPDRLAEVEQAQRDLVFVVELDDIRYRKWIWISEPGERGHFNEKAAPPEYRRAFAARGLDLLSLDPADAARRIAASAVQADLTAAVDDWALHEPELGVQKRLLEIARRADPGAWTDRLRDLAVRADKVAMQKLAADADPARTSPATLSVLATLMKRRDLSPAELLSAARASHPDDFELAFALGQWHKATGDDWQKIGPYEAARALRPENIAVWNNLGVALLNKGQVEEAIKCYRKAIDVAPKFAMLHSNLGIALYRNRKVDEAIACYQKAIKIDPKYANAHYSLGNALKGKGKVDDAIECYQKAIDIDPKLAEAHYNLGLALAGKGQVDEAIVCYHKAVDSDPKHAKAHYALGNALMGKRKVDEAIVCFQKAIASDPKHAEALTNLGLALSRQGHVDEAIACYQKAIDIDPKLANAHLNLGLALYRQGHVDEAIACYQKAIKSDPKHAKAHVALGFALADKGKVDAAIACYRKAIKIDPMLTPAHVGLGNALNDKGQVDEAVDSWRKAIEIDPENAKVLYSLGDALADKGQVDEAIDCFRKAVAIKPSFAQAHCSLGDTLYDKAKLDEAIECYAKAIALNPKFGEAHARLGQALLGKGNYAKARDASAKALALPDVGYVVARMAGQVKKDAERLLKLEARLPGLLGGAEPPPLPSECLELAQMCVHKKMPAAAAHFWGKAFASLPRSAEDMQAGHRYSAACSAALAAAGQGEDAAKLDGKERRALRQQALTWLRADLAAYSNLLEAGSLDQRVRAAGRARLITKTQVLGKGGDVYEEVPMEGALLVGFEVTYGKYNQNPTVLTVRPIFLKQGSRVMGTTHGTPGDGLYRVEAKPGYAVGAVTIKAGFGVDGMSVTFMEIGANGLNPNRAYESAWLGGMGGGPKRKLAGSGAPVVGIFGATAYKDTIFNGLGLVTANDAADIRGALAHWQKTADLAGLRDAAALALLAEERAACEKLWADVAALLQKTETRAKKETQP